MPSEGPWSHHTRNAAVADDIDFEIKGQELQFVEIELDPGESAIAEAGARGRQGFVEVQPLLTQVVERIDMLYNRGGDSDVTGVPTGFVDLDRMTSGMQGGDLNFNVVIASPDAMRVVGTLGQILGPRGLMPNPKVGTVTPDVATAVKNAKAGQVQFRVDKAGIIHGTIGRRSFEDAALKGNLAALLDALTKLKPASSKGVYLRKVAVSSTMGLGVRVDVNSINIA